MPCPFLTLLPGYSLFAGPSALRACLSGVRHPMFQLKKCMGPYLVCGGGGFVRDDINVQSADTFQYRDWEIRVSAVSAV